MSGRSPAPPARARARMSLLVALVSACASAAPAAAQSGSRLDETVSLAAAGPTLQVAIADLDADGVRDVIATSAEPAVVSVFRGTGGGAFAARVDRALPGAPRALAVADVTGDGRPDLVVACFAQWVSVLPGLGDGTFGPRLDLAAGSRPSALEVHDVTGDGRPDLVVAIEVTNQVAVLPADGAGGFGARMSHPVSGGADGLAVGHLDGDGRADVVVGATAARELTVLVGAPAGGLAYWNVVSLDAAPRTLAGAYLDADAALDVVIADDGASLTVLRGDGAGDFSSRVAWPSLAGVTGLALADVDGDGRLDAVAASPSAGAIAVHPGDGNGGFGAATEYPQAGRPHAVAAGDLNGDGRTDAAVALEGAAEVGLRIATDTRISLYAHPDPSRFGEPVMLQASVWPADATGSVTFLDGGVVRASVPLQAGVATWVDSALAAGEHVIVARYPGDAVHGPRTSEPVALSVTTTPTVTVLACTPNPATEGSPVILDALVSPRPTGGTVEFLDGVTRLGTADVVLGSARLERSDLSVGSHLLTARFSGSGAFVGSTSYPITLTIGRFETSTTALTSTPDPSVYGQVVTLRAVVTPSTATGAVRFHADGVDIATATLAGGVATCALQVSRLGTTVYSASYLGATFVAGSTSPPDSHRVDRGTTVTAVRSSLNPSRVGESVSFLATAAAAPPSSGLMYGYFQFSVDGRPLGTPVIAVAGTARSLLVSDLAPGTHAVSVTFTGDERFEGSASGAYVQVVRSDVPIIRAVRDVPQDQGRQVRVTFARSDLDVAGSATPIVRYEVFRRIPAGTGAGGVTRVATLPAGARLAGWDGVGVVGAYTDTVYNVVAPTLADSNAGGLHRATFFVRAATAVPTVYHDSAPDSGYSRDDTPPAVPSPFVAHAIATGVRLAWGAVADPDVWCYRLHRGSDPDLIPGPENLVATVDDTVFVDPVPADFVYKLAALDVNGNLGTFATVDARGLVDVAGSAPAALGLGAPRPNPAHDGRLCVELALPRPGPARLDVLDVSGRRVATRDAGALGPGRHVVELGRERALPPGLYLLRLVQGREVRLARVVVLD